MVDAVTLLSQTHCHCHNLSCLAHSAVRSDKLCNSRNFCQETSKGTLIKGIVMTNRRYVLLLLIYKLSQNPYSPRPFIHFFLNLPLAFNLCLSLRIQYNLYTMEALPDCICCYRNRLFHLHSSLRWSNWVNAEINNCKTDYFFQVHFEHTKF